MKFLCILLSLPYAAMGKQSFVPSTSSRNLGDQDIITAGFVSPGGSSSNRKLVVAPQKEICEENGIAVTASDPHYKPGAIDVLNQGTTSVIFTATQIFADKAGGSWTSIVYKDEDGDAVCQQKSSVPFGYSRSFKAQCEGGFATVDVYVSSDDWTSSSRANPNVQLCESWPQSKAELFSYKISCGVCEGCSPPPAVEIPFDPEDELCEGDGVNVRYKDDATYKPGAISILHQGSSEVIFTVNQVFNDAGAGSLVSVVYQDAEDDRWTCKESGVPLAFNFQRSYKAACDEETGVATVDVYVHNPEWESNILNPRYTDRPGVCSQWPTESPSGVALFSYALSCGVCADCVPPPPTPPSCPKENQLLSTVGQKVFPKWPIVITSQNDFSVTFEVEQTWTERATIFTQFDHDVLGASQCYQATEVEKNTKQTFTAICLPTSKVALVHIWVVDESFSPEADSAVVPDCCYSGEAPEYPTVQYTFMISCKPLCPEVARRSLLRGGTRKFLNDDL